MSYEPEESGSAVPVVQFFFLYERTIRADDTRRVVQEKKGR